MKIHAVQCDVASYQWLMPEDEKDLMTYFNFDCMSKIDTWSEISMYVLNTKMKRGNFFCFSPGGLLFDGKALDVLRDVFEMAGEILPVKLKNETLYVLNVLECANALDQQKTIWHYFDGGQRGPIITYSFHENRLTESSIFKIPETSRGEVLTYTNLKDMEDEFYSLYKKYNLTGLLFEELYSSE